MSAPQTFEDENWAVTVSDVPIRLPPPGVPYVGADTPSDEDMGQGDPNSTIYVNLKQKQIPDKYKPRISELEEMMDLTHQWLDIHAGVQTKHRKGEGKLPTDSSDASSWKRSEYRNKVVDTILQDSCAWMKHSEAATVKYHIQVKKASFHLEILKAMLKGIVAPTGILAGIESVFQGLSDLIIQTKKTSLEKRIWVLFHVMTYDSYNDEFKASFRNIQYHIKEDMYNVVVGKSSYEEIDVYFNFMQFGYGFGESTWKDIKSGIVTFIDDTAAKQVREPIEDEIPVD